jgi:hypothetical protein
MRQFQALLKARAGLGRAFVLSGQSASAQARGTAARAGRRLTEQREQEAADGRGLHRGGWGCGG